MRWCWLGMGALACGEDQKTGDPTPTGEPGPGAFATDFDTSPDFFTQMAGPVESLSVHQNMQIWYSVNLRDLLEAGEPFVAPEGSVATKRQIAPSGAVLFNTMIKLAEGESADGLDWFWEQRNESMTVTNDGAIAFCVGCHTGYPDFDYLAGTEIR